jgi:hypothetical protein
MRMFRQTSTTRSRGSTRTWCREPFPALPPRPVPLAIRWSPPLQRRRDHQRGRRAHFCIDIRLRHADAAPRCKASPVRSRNERRRQELIEPTAIGGAVQEHGRVCRVNTSLADRTNSMNRRFARPGAACRRAKSCRASRRRSPAGGEGHRLQHRRMSERQLDLIWLNPARHSTKRRDGAPMSPRRPWSVMLSHLGPAWRRCGCRVLVSPRCGMNEGPGPEEVFNEIQAAPEFRPPPASGAR